MYSHSDLNLHAQPNCSFAQIDVNIGAITQKLINNLDLGSLFLSS